ncbi:MAG: HdeD family acid-resistance protein [Thermosynechococcaceae cyanobacterium]
MTSSNVSGGNPPGNSLLNPGWKPALLGLLIIGLGLVAIALPFFTTLAVEAFVAWLLIGSGILQFIHSVQVRYSKTAVLQFIWSIFYISGGLILLFYPLAGVLSLTLSLGAFILIGGAIQTAMAIQQRPESGWLWHLGGGIVGVLFGIVIIAAWPVNAPWLLGLLVGFNLISDGTPLLALAFSDRTGGFWPQSQAD